MAAGVRAVVLMLLGYSSIAAPASFGESMTMSLKLRGIYIM